jgi:hypothetical protein
MALRKRNAAQMTRRMSFALIFTLLSQRAFAQPKLGDEEWMRRFRDFVKMFNAFVEALNDGNFDVSRWRHMQSAWKGLEVE